MSDIPLHDDIQVETQPLNASIATALFLPMLYALAYWGSGWVTGDADAIALALPLEDHIPLLPWMIIPYLSLNVVFLLSAFLCETRRELALMVTRLLLVLAVALVVFILYPTTTSFSNSHVEGLLAGVFDWLNRIDVRNNAFPSLHVAMAVVLWPHLRRGATPPARPLVHTWLAFVVASTVLTHRHHVLDAVAGAALGLVAVALVRRREAAAKVI